MARTTTVTCDCCGKPIDGPFSRVTIEAVACRVGEVVPVGSMLDFLGVTFGNLRAATSAVPSADYCSWPCLIRRLIAVAKSDGSDLKDLLTEETPK